MADSVSRKPRLRVKLLAVGIALFIALLLAELVARVVAPASVWDAYLFYEGQIYEEDAGGAIRYRPEPDDGARRVVAVWGEQMEYDIPVPINDLGFIDTEDYGAAWASDGEGREIAFVGDSFVAGFHAGDGTWLGKLRDRARSAGEEVDVYNLGLSGAGLAHFEKLLASTHAEGMAPDVICFGVIGNDFSRAFWQPVYSEDRLWHLYPGATEEEARGAPPAGVVIGAETSAEEIASLLPELKGERVRAAASEAGGGIKGLLYRSRVVQLVFQTIWSIRGNSGGGDDPWEFFETMAQTYPDSEVHVFHFPEKHEVEAGAYDPVGGDPSASLADSGVSYHPLLDLAAWDISKFHPHDPHPNAEGYELVIRAVAEALELKIE